MLLRNERTNGWLYTGYKPKKKCERCGMRLLQQAGKPLRGKLIVHHKDRNKASNLDHSNLETLCRVCHRLEHAAEIAAAQRRPEVNARRGAAVSAARKGKHYAADSAALRANWALPVYRAQMVAAHNKPSAVHNHAEAMRKLMNDPMHIEKRRLMKEARRAQSS